MEHAIILSILLQLLEAEVGSRADKAKKQRFHVAVENDEDDTRVSALEISQAFSQPDSLSQQACRAFAVLQKDLDRSAHNVLCYLFSYCFHCC